MAKQVIKHESKRSTLLAPVKDDPEFFPEERYTGRRYTEMRTTSGGVKTCLDDDWLRDDDKRGDEVEEFTGFTVLEMWPDSESEGSSATPEPAHKKQKGPPSPEPDRGSVAHSSPKSRVVRAKDKSKTGWSPPGEP